LRERREDIEELATYLAERAAIRFSLAPCRPTAADIEILRQYPWPGNIRELGAVMDRAAILGEGKSLDLRTALGFFSEEGHSSPLQPSTLDSSVRPAGRLNGEPATDWSLDNVMRLHIERVLQMTQGRIEGPHGAAVLLRINPHTLRARMRKLKIRWTEFRGGGSEKLS
jgi:DNA-binding NtrC family response regulator